MKYTVSDRPLSFRHTAYINSAVTKAHVTNHQVAGPTVHQPVSWKSNQSLDDLF